jgi:hypothetical protein
MFFCWDSHAANPLFCYTNEVWLRHQPLTGAIAIIRRLDYTVLKYGFYMRTLLQEMKKVGYEEERRA